MSDDEDDRSESDMDEEEKLIVAEERRMEREEKEAQAAKDALKRGEKKRAAPARGKRKDKNKPKGACNAYTLYMKAKSKHVKEENTELKQTDIMKLVGQMWKVATPDEKAEFQAQAEEDKVRYKDEMSRYVPPDFSSDEEPTAARKKKKKRDKNAPKAPANAYSIFMKEKSKELAAALPAGEKPKDLFKTVSLMWKTVSKEDKVVYAEEAKKDKERYRIEMLSYTKGVMAIAPAKPTDTKEEAVRKESGGENNDDDDDENDDDDFEEDPPRDPHLGSSHVVQDDDDDDMSEDGSGEDSDEGDSDVE